MSVKLAPQQLHRPLPFRAGLELLKPITWFPPMWAFACGIVSSGANVVEHASLVVLGVLLAGPLVCGTSQVINDWFDRHVDAVNEPHRPIPSGRIPGHWGLYLALIWTGLSLLLGYLLGPIVFAGTVLGLALAWAYSAPPFRLKRNGWFGNSAVGLCYEGLPWFIAAALMLGAIPPEPILALALLYSVGGHGILTLNDFKAMEGDRQHGIRSLPVLLGERRAAWTAAVFMIAPQLGVVALLAINELAIAAAIIGVLIATQLALLPTLFRAPSAKAPWYNGTGVLAFVLGMMVAAIAVRSLV